MNSLGAQTTATRAWISPEATARLCSDSSEVSMRSVATSGRAAVALRLGAAVGAR